MASLDPGVLESVINLNFKALVEQELISSQDHRNRVRVLAEKAMGSTLMQMDTTNVDVSEAQATQTVSQSGMAGQIASLAAAVASLQGLIKAGQTVPPVTP
jgi:hypothetical protein